MGRHRVGGFSVPSLLGEGRSLAPCRGCERFAPGGGEADDCQGEGGYAERQHYSKSSWKQFSIQLDASASRLRFAFWGSGVWVS